MTSPSLTNAPAWMAAGVQHAVLIRALPAVRHDLASPLSVMRMGMTVFKRRVASSDGLAPAQSVERVEQLEEQLSIIGDHVRRLRHWDLNIHEAQPARDTLAQAIELAKPLLALRGVLLQPEPLPAAPAGTEEAAVGHHALLYVTLAAIYYLGELPGETPAEVVAEVTADTIELRAQGTPRADALPPLVTAGAQGTPPIDATALQCLAEHLGVRVRSAARRVVIDLA